MKRSDEKRRKSSSIRAPHNPLISSLYISIYLFEVSDITPSPLPNDESKKDSHFFLEKKRNEQKQMTRDQTEDTGSSPSRSIADLKVRNDKYRVSCLVLTSIILYM
jgi:hypothetical protein